MKKIINKIILLNKKEGETPLEALGVFRRKNPKYKNERMTYAGRLDPMASGLLLLLFGEEVKKKEKYLAFSKEYEFEVLFGFNTDTYDILGKVQHSHILKNVGMSERELEKKIKQSLKYFTGKFVQKYPPYSSKTVKGKPMFEYARENIAVEAPEREVSVKILKFIKIKPISNTKLLENIEQRIKKVNGDFRQEAIIKVWRKSLPKNKTDKFFLANFKIKCGSGTYVRGIVHTLGEKIKVPALTYSIHRARIGKWVL